MPSFKAKYSYTIKRGANPGGGGGNMTTDKDYSLNLSVQQVLSLWVQGSALHHFTGMRNERCRYSAASFFIIFLNVFSEKVITTSSMCSFLFKEEYI